MVVVMTMSGLFLWTQIIRCQEVNLVLLALSNFVQATPMVGVVVIEYAAESMPVTVRNAVQASL